MRSENTRSCAEIHLLWATEARSSAEERVINEHLLGCEACFEALATIEGEVDDVGSGVTWPIAYSDVSAEPIAAVSEHAERPRRRVSEYAVRADRYVVLEEAGQGGMGSVHKAWDTRLGREVALKLLRPELERSTLSEAKALAKLSDHNTVRIYDFGRFDGGVFDGRSFLAMEFVDGVSLGAWARQQETRADRWRRIVEKYVDAGRGLAAMHKAGLVHRDFKPDNVIVESDGRAVLIDFGLACRERSNTRELKGGTPTYMSPEQLADNGVVDSRSDQFSFCVALYEALYRQQPFPGKKDDPERFANGIVRPINAHSKRLWKALSRGLSSAPEQRFETMDGLITALDRALRPTGVYIGGGVAGVAGLAVSAIAAASIMSTPAELQNCIETRITTSLLNPAREAFSASPIPIARSVWSAVSASLDHYTNELSREKTELCELRREHDQPQLFAERESCFRELSRDLELTVSILSDPDQTVVEKAGELVSSLKRVERCSNSSFLLARASERWSSDEKAELEDIERQLARIRVSALAGRIGRVAPTIRDLGDRVRDLEHLPLRARVLQQLGELDIRSADESEVRNGEDALVEAAILARNTKHYDLASDSYNTLGTFAQRSGDPERRRRGYTWVEEAMRISNKTSEPGLYRALALNNHGQLLFRDKRMKDAIVQLREALTLAERHGARPLRVAAHMHDLANVLSANGEIDEARTLYEKSVTIQAQHLGELHPRTASLNYDFGLFLLDNGETEEAFEWLESSHRILSEVLDSNHRLVGKRHLALSESYLRVGNFAKAEEHARAGLDIFERRKDKSYQLTRAHILVGAIAFRQAEFAPALEQFEHALASADGELMRGVVSVNIGETLVELGRYADARAALGEARKSFSTGEAPPEAYLGLLSKAEGLLHLAQNRLRRAELALGDARDKLDATPNVPADKAEIDWGLARVYGATGRVTRARDLASKAREVFVSLRLDHRVAAIDAWRPRR